MASRTASWRAVGRDLGEALGGRERRRRISCRGFPAIAQDGQRRLKCPATVKRRRPPQRPVPTPREQQLERGYKGLVAKDETSVYVGGRTRAWVKVKQPN